MSNAYQFRDSAMKSDSAVEPRPIWSEDEYRAMNRRFFVAMVSSQDFKFTYPRLAESLHKQIKRKLMRRRTIRARRVYYGPVGPFETHDWPQSNVGFPQRIGVNGRVGCITGEDVLERVAYHFGMPVIDLKSDRRTMDIVFPRQVAFWLMKRHTTYSITRIGEIVGGRNHKTVLHGIRKIDAFLEGQRKRGASVPPWAPDSFMEAAE